MAISEDEANPDLLTDYPAGKMGQSFPLEISHVGPAKKGFPCSLIINPILTKFVRSGWFDIGLVLCLFLLPSTSSLSIKRQKRTMPK